MSNQENSEFTRDEIKKEFQLERMILFSDAVFAIVITLMAMEIKLPETVGNISLDLQTSMLKHLIPTFIAYSVSFFFIGAIWYQHLKMFSLLKDYDKGLVIRNLSLLFFIGLFPFCASVITRSNNSSLAFYLYIGIIFICIIVQYILFHYILIQRPELRVNVNIENQLIDLLKRKYSLIGFSITIILIIVTRYLITDMSFKPLSTLWMVAFPIFHKLITRKLDKKIT